MWRQKLRKLDVYLKHFTRTGSGGDKHMLQGVKFRYGLVLIVAFFCLLPFFFSPFGITTEAREYVLLSVVQQGLSFALSIIVVLLCFLRFVSGKYQAFAVIGLAFFCVSLLNGFHTFSIVKAAALSTGKIAGESCNWSVLQVFHSGLLFLAIGISIYGDNAERRRTTDLKGNLVKIGATFIFITAVVLLVLLFRNTGLAELGSDSYDSYIRRPLDLLSLVLYILGGILTWIWRSNHVSIFRFALLLSFIPHIVKQINLVFGTNVYFGVDFNIAFSLTILSHLVICLGLFVGLVRFEPHQDVESIEKDSAETEFDFEFSPLPTSSSSSLMEENLTREKVVQVGRVSHPLVFRLPLTAFFTAFIVSLLVSFGFYLESKRLILKQSVKELEIESQLIEPLLTQLFREASSSITFLSQASVFQSLSLMQVDNEHESVLWKSKIESIYFDMLSSNEKYLQVCFVEAAGVNRELISILRGSAGISRVPEQRLKPLKGAGVILAAQGLKPGEIYFSSIEVDTQLSKKSDHISGENSYLRRLLVRTAAPVFDAQGELIGITVLSIDFGSFVREYVVERLQNLRFYLADEEGKLLFHPDRAVDFSDSLTLQDAFPEIKKHMLKDFAPLGFMATRAGKDEQPSYYRPINLGVYDNNRFFHLILQKQDDFINQELLDFRDRSFILGFVFSLFALALSILVSRRVVQPLSEMTHAVQLYEQTGKLDDLPMYASDETGVLARSFYNLLARIDKALQEKNETSNKLQAILNSAADGIITIDAGGRILSVNAAAEEIFRYKEDELVGENVNKLMSETHAAMHDKYIEKYLRTGKASIIGVGRELFGVRKGGELFPMHLSISEVHALEGRLFTGLVRDISTEKEQQRQLAETRKYVDGITSTVPVLLSYVDDKLRYKFVNEKYELWFNKPTSAFKGKLISELVGEKAFQKLKPYIDCVMSGKQTTFDFTLPRQTGEAAFVRVNYIPDIDEIGEVIGFYASIEDVTDSREAASKMRELSWRLDFALSGPGIGVWDYNINTNELIWDKRMYQLYGIDGEDFSGAYEAWEAGVHPDDIDKARAALNRAVLTGEDFISEFRVCWPNGQVRYLEAHGKLFSEREGEIKHLVGTNIDVTDKKALERERELALIAAQESAKMKSEFLASMSHEIRTPMNGVLGMLGLLQRGEMSSEQYRYTSLAKSSAESLLSIINDILDFSKVEAGKLELEILEFDLRSLLGEFAESVGHRAQEKGLELVLDVIDVNDSMVSGDPGRLRQILTNLVGNAIKFTSHGEIVISASLSKVTKEDLLLTCSVSDTGMGIPEEKLNSLFDAFTQVDASTTRQFGGTGLGLAIANQLCQLMGGEIKVRSELGTGSVFTFCLRLYTSENSERVEPNVDMGNMKVLVVDDNETNRKVLRRQLKVWGAQVYDADSGQAALELIKKQADEATHSLFTVALIDMQMPNMGGVNLSKSIRTDSRCDNMKLVMMTSIGTQIDKDVFASLGFSAYFPKPATTSDLFAVLNNVIHGGTLQEDSGTSADHLNNLSLKPETEAFVSWPSDTRILLVEDNYINQTVAIGLLEDMGLSCDVAGNGVETLIALERCPEGAPYTLILMDCQMPEMDGYEATRQIRNGRAGETYVDVQIIAMTANAMKGDREKCLAVGMNDYLSKPIEPRKLENILRQRLLGSQDASDIPDSLQEPLTSIWDFDSLLKRVGSKESRVRHLVELFLRDIPKNVESLEESIAQERLSEGREVAHAIKGVCLNLSATKLGEQMKALEMACKEGRHEDAKNILVYCLNYYQELLLTLEAYIKSAVQD